jgi:predicted house-cleaning noncanonical NTP pyrophosphatase (MazG superfamily)
VTSLLNYSLPEPIKSSEKDGRENLNTVLKNDGPTRRHRLAESFIAELHTDWSEDGVAAIEKVRQERLADYLKIIASLIPKEVHIKENLEDVRDAGA